MKDLVENYMKEHKITTLIEFGKMVGLTSDYLSLIRKGSRISKNAWKKLCDFFKCDMPYPFYDRGCFAPPETLPDWVKKAKMRKLVEQEYYVDPERARIFAEAETYEDIKELRQQAHEMNGYGESTINLMEMENII